MCLCRPLKPFLTGSRTLISKAGADQVDVAVVNREGYLVCSVKDSGRGVPDDQLVRVTERFYRVPGTVSSGSGLGLSIVSEISPQRRTLGAAERQRWFSCDLLSFALAGDVAVGSAREPGAGAA